MRPVKDQVITGSTDGLGRKVALDLAKEGAMFLHGRNPEKGRKVLREIADAAGNNRLTYYNADLSSLEAVRGLADQIAENNEQLDVLINNAAIGARSPESRRVEC